MLDRSDFLLNKHITFLNHGSFGACPREILAEQQRWIELLESEPVKFFRELPENMAHARASLADYIGARTQDVVYVTNSTYGTNVAVHALACTLVAGDEILMTDHEYGACERAWKLLCEHSGARIVKAHIPDEGCTEEELVHVIWKHRTDKTRVLFLSHITSPTAIQIPVAPLCALAREFGVVSVIDGSHAPGHIDLDLSALGADIYTANCHKWMCTPKGSAFLWVRPNIQPLVKPVIVSWGNVIPTAGEGAFIDEHEYLGTRDVSPFLTVPYAIQWMAKQPWSAVQQHSRSIIDAATSMLEALGMRRVSSCELQMVAAELPASTDVEKLKTWLYQEKAIEVVVHRWLNQPLIRVSAHAHTCVADIAKLESALQTYYQR